MKKIALYLCFLAFLCSCASDEFTITGSWLDAKGQTAYLERHGIDKTEIIDTCVLNSQTGDFSFSALRPEAPEFYHLRVNGRTFVFAIDSTERVVVNIDSTVSVKGSPNTQKIIEVQNEVRTAGDTLSLLFNSFTSGRITRQQLDDSIYSVVLNYKTKMREMIQKNPSSVVSYYALFKKLPFQISVFDPYDPADYHYFVLVANMWKKKYPNSLRFQQLVNMMADAKQKNKVVKPVVTDDTPVSANIDIVLADHVGRKVALSSLKGKSVLLLFCYLADMDDDVLTSLGYLRNMYKDKFEIYMVNYDKNIRMWRDKSATYPWISVLDLDESTFQTYNLKNLPSNFLLDMDGNIVDRDLTIQNLIQLLQN